jgi:hypothetical protein
MATLNHDQIATLEALANGIIPSDERDAGAAEVKAAEQLAGKIRNGIHSALYLRGIDLAQALARNKFARPVAELTATEIYEWIADVRETDPGFFKQLRMDVSVLYLGDPGVWQRIGFPGPSTASGGYPDFDQPQTTKLTQLKEPQS